MMGKSKEVSIDSMGFKVIDRGQQKLAKLCVVCQRLSHVKNSIIRSSIKDLISK